LNLALIISIFGILLFVFYQDVKYRQIHIVLPVLIFLNSFYFLTKKNYENYQVLLYNIVFVVLTIGLLVVYMSVKNKSFLNPFANYFGLGDLLFFLAITPLFVTYNYILYFIFSMVFSAVLQLFFSKIMKVKTVPLAGFAALFLILIITKDLIFGFSKITLIV